MCFPPTLACAAKSGSSRDRPFPRHASEQLAPAPAWANFLPHSLHSRQQTMNQSFPSTGQSRDEVTHVGPEKPPDATHARPVRGGERNLHSSRSLAVGRLVGIYVVVSGAWILLSDKLVSAL